MKIDENVENFTLMLTVNHRASVQYSPERFAYIVSDVQIDIGSAATVMSAKQLQFPQREKRVSNKRFLKKYDYKIYIICDRDHLNARKPIKQDLSNYETINELFNVRAQIPYNLVLVVGVDLMLLKLFLPVFSLVKKESLRTAINKVTNAVLSLIYQLMPNTLQIRPVYPPQ
uniref:Uncharacterized protein n=1 Tax=Glossina austeni TaxID=7395 RepID=A0A1A9VBH7_GLOAU